MREPAPPSTLKPAFPPQRSAPGSPAAPSQIPKTPPSLYSLPLLFLQRFARVPQRKFQRLPRHALHKRPDCPTHSRRNPPRQRNRFDLHVQPAIALLVAPIRIQPPQKSMFLIRRQRSLLRCSSVLNFRNLRAPRNAPPMPCIESSVRHVIRHIQHDREHVLLLD